MNRQIGREVCPSDLAIGCVTSVIIFLIAGCTYNKGNNEIINDTVCSTGIHDTRTKSVLVKAAEESNWIRIYNIELPFAEAGNIQEEFDVASLMIEYIPKQGAEYDANAIMWLRKAAYAGCPPAIVLIEGVYKEGWHHIHRNRVLADCFNEAELNRAKLQRCKMLEDSDSISQFP